MTFPLDRVWSLTQFQNMSSVGSDFFSVGLGRVL